MIPVSRPLASVLLLETSVQPEAKDSHGLLMSLLFKEDAKDEDRFHESHIHTKDRTHISPGLVEASGPRESQTKMEERNT